MSRRKQQGSAPMIVLAVVIVVAAIGGIGWYVWRSTQVANRLYTQNTQTNDSNTTYPAGSVAHLTGPCHTLDASMNGKLLQDRNYSFCILDGWKLWQGSSFLLGDATGLVYASGISSQLATLNGGRDGAGSFAVYYNAKAASAPTGFTASGSVQAVDVTGIKYTRSQTTAPGEGSGGVPQDTRQIAYFFTKNGHSLEIDYNLFPGDADHSAEVAQVVQTLKLY